MEELMGSLFADANLLATLGGYAYTIIKVLVGLGLVIFVHELGHFLVAKACGVKCEKFYVGFDVPMGIGPFKLPRALWRKQWGETEYGIGIIPLGGYVKMLGQDDNPNNAEAEAERIRGGGAQGAGELDPRSYPAKSVPQRMAIISAGVIMNVIFAVIFAAIAYGMGVSYMPSIVGTAAAGSPAWTKGMKPGDQVLQIGQSDSPHDHLRFDKDLRVKVFFHGEEGTLPFLVRRADGEQEWVNLEPTSTTEGKRKRPIIGIAPLPDTALARELPVSPGFPAASLSPGFAAGDRVVAIDERPVRTYADIQSRLAQHPDHRVTFTVERSQPGQESSAEAERLEIAVPPTPWRSLGAAMTMGPVMAVRDGSPAAQAGIRPGDVLLRVAGEPVGDPATLTERLLPHVGETIDLEIQRGNETLTVAATPEPPLMYHSGLSRDIRMGAEPLGLAYHVVPKVAEVEEGSPAANAGLQAGDVVVQAEFEAPEPEGDDPGAKLFQALVQITAPEPIQFSSDGVDWALADNLLNIVPTVRVKLTYERNGKTIQSDFLATASSSQWHYPHRGLQFRNLEKIHQAASLPEAFSLGLRETKEQLVHVLTVLKLLFTGRVSPTDLGGPVSIAAAAGSEASKGVPELLIFLTFLSANLAIVNFLPIPVLDGGHMVFLIAEAVRGKPVDEQIVFKLTMGGLVFLLGLMIFVTAMDIGRVAEWLGQ